LAFSWENNFQNLMAPCNVTVTEAWRLKSRSDFLLACSDLTTMSTLAPWYEHFRQILSHAGSFFKRKHLVVSHIFIAWRDFSVAMLIHLQLVLKRHAYKTSVSDTQVSPGDQDTRRFQTTATSQLKAPSRTHIVIALSHMSSTHPGLPVFFSLLNLLVQSIAQELFSILEVFSVFSSLSNSLQPWSQQSFGQGVTNMTRVQLHVRYHMSSLFKRVHPGQPETRRSQ